ncbi:MAG: tRNA-dihydrouridine synthase [Methanosphaera sp.]|nr:tRNA-dihydrouridine synthase [Methanosphaera sp.]
MNVLSAMAGINDGEFCKKFTKQNVDIITLGGYNIDLETFKAGLQNSIDDRQEFITCPHHLSEDIDEQINIIKEYNPKWKGKISANLRAVSADSFKAIYKNTQLDIAEINAHCRQKATQEAGAGQALLKDEKTLLEMVEAVCENTTFDISVKIRANVEGVDTLKIVESIESYPVKYLHVDAFNPGVDEPDYEIINRIASITNMHVIANNCITSHERYQKMLDYGASSVSVARAALDGDISHIFQ